MKVASWLAYLQFTSPEKFWSFALDDGVFYVNAIVSAMEMSAVRAKNASLLSHKYYTGGSSSQTKDNPTPSDIKSEL